MKTIAGFALAVLLGCSPGGVDGDRGGDREAVATVGDIVITLSEFESAAVRRAQKNDGRLSADGKRAVLDELIDDKLLYLKALEMGLDRSPVVQRMLVASLLGDALRARTAKVSDAELRAYYDAHRADFSTPRSVQVGRVLIRYVEDQSTQETEAEAERIREMIVLHPEDFAVIARQHSQGPYKNRGGHLGSLTSRGRADIDPEIVSRAFEMELEDISPVFETDEGLNVIYLAARQPGVARPFEPIKRGPVLRAFTAARGQEIRAEYLARLKREGTPRIEVNEEVLAAFDSGR